MRLAFTVEYDGTDFSGFQKQKNASTIQEKIEEAIKTVTGSDITINYSGRTDAGVHALSQVFDFETSIKRDNKNWIDGINSNLPKTISVDFCVVDKAGSLEVITFVCTRFFTWQVMQSPP